MHRKRSALRDRVQHDAREHNPASSSFFLPPDVFAPLERPPLLPSSLLSTVSIPPSSERGVARRSSQAVRLSAGIKYSRWVGVARRSTEWRGVGATRRGVQRCVGRCWGVRRGKEGNRREGGTETILSLFHVVVVSPSPFLPPSLSFPSLYPLSPFLPLRPTRTNRAFSGTESREALSPSSDGSAPGAPARLGGVAVA